MLKVVAVIDVIDSGVPDTSSTATRGERQSQTQQRQGRARVTAM
jgi:hypothetical protein